MYRKTTLAAFSAALGLWAGTALAAPPTTITYSGFLTSNTGTPVTIATDLTFRFYDAASLGTQVGTADVVTVIPTSDGYFTAIVGTSIASFSGLFDTPVWMTVQVEGDAAEMTPRIPITSVPSALSVDWSGISNRPVSSCGGTTPFVTGVDIDGKVTCAAAPAGAGSCGSGQIMRWAGAAWACVIDQVGTVTSVVSGSGLTGGTITTTGTLSANFTAAGGDNGAATTVARGDHTHDARYAMRCTTVSNSVTVGANAASGSVVASCTSPDLMVGGGYWVQGPYNIWDVPISRPWGSTGWDVWGWNNSASAQTLTAYVRCCRITP